MGCSFVKAAMAGVPEVHMPHGHHHHMGGNYILENDGKISDKYDVDKKVLGEGKRGSVSKCVDKSTKKEFACKATHKAKIEDIRKFAQEIELMKRLDHPNIIKLFETFEDKTNIYLIMELCTGGELFDRIIHSEKFTEVQAAIVMQHIFRAINYMHEQHICHRGLKPENFLLTTGEPIDQVGVKLINFGLACEFADGHPLTTKQGSPYYVAPEVLQGRYNHLIDLWSCGVLMYVLLCGAPPFDGPTDADVLAKVRSGTFSFNPKYWSAVSDDAKNLIRNLLKMNPLARYTAGQALNHAWVKNKAPKAKKVPLSMDLVGNLRQFRSHNKFKKSVLHIIASQLSDSQSQKLRDIFMKLDDNGDGMLTTQEIKDGLSKGGFDEVPPDLQQIMQEVDDNGNGMIDYTEFLAATLDQKTYLQEDVCWAAFRTFDRDGSGTISKTELASILNAGEPMDIDDLVVGLDEDGDGEIDFQEFMHMMRGGHTDCIATAT